MVEVIPGNALQSTLNGAITDTATTLTIQAADMASWPASGNYRCVIYTDALNGPWELVTVTGGQGTATLTVSRASEPYRGTQLARAWASGATITPVVTTDVLSALGGKVLLDYLATTDITPQLTVTPLSTWIDVPGTTQQFTPTSSSAPISIGVSGGILMYAAGGGYLNGIALRVVLDNDNSTGKLLCSYDGENLVRATMFGGGQVIYPNGLSAQQHSVKLQVWSNGSNTNLYIRPATYQHEFLAYRIVQGSGIGSPLLGATSVISVQDRKAQNVDGGDFNSGAWRTRDLNYLAVDTTGLAVVAANRVTVPAGSWDWEFSAPAYRVDRHKTRLQNITDGTTVEYGTTEFSWSGSAGGNITRSSASGRLVLTAPKVFEVQHYCDTTNATYGFAPAANHGPEIYTVLRFQTSQIPGSAVPTGGSRLLLNVAETTELAYNVGIAAATWINFGSVRTIYVDDPNAVIEIMIGGNALLGGAGGSGNFGTAILVDGTTRYVVAGGRLVGADFANIFQGVTPLTLVGLSAGNHTLQVQFNSAQGASWFFSPPREPVNYAFAMRVLQLATSPQPGIPGPGASPIKGPEVVLSAGASSVTLPVSGQLLQTYRNLRIVWSARSDYAGLGDNLFAQINGDVGNNYDSLYMYGYPNNGYSVGGQNGQSHMVVSDTASANAPAGYFAIGEMLIPNYASATQQKAWQGSGISPRSASDFYRFTVGGAWRSVAPITSIKFFPATGGFVAGTVFTLYYDP